MLLCHDLVAGKSEVRTALLMAGTEDIPELFVQLGFLLTVEGEAVETMAEIQARVWSESSVYGDGYRRR